MKNRPHYPTGTRHQRAILCHFRPRSFLLFIQSNALSTKSIWPLSPCCASKRLPPTSLRGLGGRSIYLHDGAEPGHLRVLVLRGQHGERAPLQLGLPLGQLRAGLLHHGVRVELGGGGRLRLASRHRALAPLQPLHLQEQGLNCWPGCRMWTMV